MLERLLSRSYRLKLERLGDRQDLEILVCTPFSGPQDLTRSPQVTSSHPMIKRDYVLYITKQLVSRSGLIRYEAAFLTLPRLDAVYG